MPARKVYGIVSRRASSLARENRLGIVFIIPALLFLAVLILYPVLYTAWISLFNMNYFAGISTFVGLQNYAIVLRDVEFWRSLLNGILWTVGSLGGQLLLGLSAALVIHRPGKAIVLFRSLLLIPYVIPAIATALVWRWMFNDIYGIVSHFLSRLGLISVGASPLADINLALPSTILVNVWRGFPFTMIVYWAALQSIPDELYEAAKVDGASPISEFRYITLPHLKHVTLILVVLRTMWEFNYFDLIYLLTKGGPAGATQHLPILVFIRSMGLFMFGNAATVAVLMGLFLTILICTYVKIYGFDQL